jgi:hypothetical protein
MEDCKRILAEFEGRLTHSGSKIREIASNGDFFIDNACPCRHIEHMNKVITGQPDFAHVSTSFSERQNLNIRMGMRRFTRLTNAFSKKLANLEANVALYFMHYNFCRIHQTLRVTPAMEAGIADHIWTMAEVVALIDGNSN